MTRSLFALFLVVSPFVFSVEAQRKRPVAPTRKPVANQTAREIKNVAVVVNERLAVLRSEPSLYAMPVQRMRSGRALAVSAARETDGVTFYRVVVPPRNYGWVQADAVISKFRRGDDEKLARLVQASEGFDQIERAMIFLDNFPNSALRPPILLLTGDLIEENARRISAEAHRRLDKGEIVASGAPAHSYFLNYTSLDRFRKIGANFLFNAKTRTFHYDGAAWKEILAKFPNSSESMEARKRLDSLKEKMERTSSQ